MKLIERNGLRILYPKYGYLLRNTITNDIHAGKIYLGANSSLEDFEEIRDESASAVLIDTMNDNVGGEHMKLIERNGLRILYPKYGYLLRNTITNDIHAGKIYLGVHSFPEDFDEIRDENVSEILIDTINDVETKEKSLTKIGKIVANQVTDDALALEIQEFYDTWQSGVAYEAGRYITYNDILYKVLTTHTSQDDWAPDVAASLFANVLTSLNGTPQEWVQPNSTNAYMTGDKVIYEGVVYVSIIDNNTWSPAAYPAGWQVVEEE